MNRWTGMAAVVRGTLVALLLCVAGCQEFLAEQMVAPPNGGRSETQEAGAPEKDGRLHISVGPPAATLAAWVLEPRVRDPQGVKGTILLLHGFLNDHGQLTGVAQSLRDAGYRAVLVDLRGHGQSTGEHITYGVDDARDLAQVTDYLQKQQLCGAEVGVYGASYGAVSAILFAGSDPRVKAVVAVAPFASLREVAPYFGRHVLPVPGIFFSQADYSHIVDRMGELAGFDPAASSPLAAIQKTEAHVRLFHGDADLIIPWQGSEELAAAAPDRTELTIVHGQGHLGLCFDVFGELHEPAREWFDRWLVPTAGQGH